MPVSTIGSAGLDNPLGIGTSTPVQNFQILSSSGASGTLSLSGSAPNSTGGPSYILMGNSDSAGTPGPNVVVAANRSLSFGVGTSFSTAGGGTFTPHMGIDSSGRVTKPLQPSFHAHGANVFASSNYLIYPTVRFNIGNHYNATTGIFTAPITGTYLFGWTQIGGNGNTVYRFFFRVNNANVSNGDLHHRLDTSASGGEYAANGVYTMPWRLNAGDTARIWYVSDDGTGMYPFAVSPADDYPRFWGHLLG
jgi:hypothetical protein